MVRQNTDHRYLVMLPGDIVAGDSTSFNTPPGGEVILMLFVDGGVNVWRSGPGSRNTDGKIHTAAYPTLAN